MDLLEIINEYDITVLPLFNLKTSYLVPYRLIIVKICEILDKSDYEYQKQSLNENEVILEYLIYLATKNHSKY